MPKLDSVRIISRDASLTKRFTNIAKSVVHTADHADGAKGANHAVTVLDPDGYQFDVSLALIGKLRVDKNRGPIMILSDRFERDFVYPLLQAGAGGYVLKSASDAFLSDSLIDLKLGYTPLSSRVATHVIELVLPRKPAMNGAPALKPGEVEVLHLLSRGFTKTQISVKTGINIHTVDNYIRRIYCKLGAKNVGEAIAKAFRLGIIS